MESLYFPYGFEPELVSRIDKKPYGDIDVSFIGSLAVASGHLQRGRDLAALCKQISVSCWLSQFPQTTMGLAKLYAGLLRACEWKTAGRTLQMLPQLWTLMHRNRGELYGIEMLSALAASRITVNVHIDVAGGEAANVRLFEATGVGTCLVTDWKPNLCEHFVPDKEVVTFRTAAEAAEKIRYLLTNETERAAIATRGQKRTLTSHSMQSRIAMLVEHLMQRV